MRSNEDRRVAACAEHGSGPGNAIISPEISGPAAGSSRPAVLDNYSTSPRSQHVFIFIPSGRQQLVDRLLSDCRAGLIHTHLGPLIASLELAKSGACLPTQDYVAINRTQRIRQRPPDKSNKS